MNACSWPEQDAVDAWLKKHNVDVSKKVGTELKAAVTKPRIDLQNKLTAIKLITKDC